MKRILLLAVVLSAVGLNAQAPAVKAEKAVGIETSQPRATLDVNGDARLQKVELMISNTPTEEIFKDCPCVLTIDKYGVIKRIPKTQFLLADGSIGTGSSQGGNPNTGGNNGGSNNQSSGGANLGTGAKATISNQSEYIVSLVYKNAYVQGEINNSDKKILVSIPYTNGNGAQYNEATSATITSEASSQDGTTSPIMMTIKAGTLKIGNGVLEAEITTPSSYFVKKLAPGVKEKIADFKYTLSGVTRTVSVIAFGGIPDKLWGEKTNNKLEHQFVYLPVQGPDGKTWLNNNLGAAYARVDNPVGGKFAPQRQATSNSDIHAFGSYYQRGRIANDGYELVNWVDDNTSSAVYPNKPWYSGGQLNNIEWNPCPSGFHVPTVSEFERLVSVVGSFDTSWGQPYTTQLRMPKAGQRNNAKANKIKDSSWSSSYASNQLGSSAKILYIGAEGNSVTHSGSSTQGLPVRCIKD